MTTSKIAEGNKILSEYLLLSDTGCIIFNESWGLLMLVVEKISSEVHPEYFKYCPDRKTPFEDTAWPRTFGMRSPEGKYLVRFNACPLSKADTLLEAAWLACVDFVKELKERV